MFRFKKWSRTALAAAVAALMFSAGAAYAEADPDFDPPLAPLPDHPPIPADNKSSTAVYPAKMGPKQELGYLLFFDPKITGDMSLSCATCHHPDTGWGFNDPISRGYPGTVHWRNSQSVMNSGYWNKLFWAGSVTSLEAQAPSANKGGVAGNGESDMMESRLRLTPEYRRRWKEVFGHDRPLIKDAWRAIAAFERYLSQPDTPYDRYLKGDEGAISDAAKRGLKLFKGKAKCVECHNGPMLTDEKYYNLGVPQPIEWTDSGIHQITFRFEQYAKGVTEAVYRDTKQDLGVYYREKSPQHKMKFRTATLRYTKYAAPYMHNGVFFTLEEVVDFYNKGGGDNDPYGTKTKILEPLNLTGEEKADLVEFLLTLSGEEIKLPVPKIPPIERVADWEPRK
ncbi:MAG: cytochrome-c peroxidase [Candidatus Nitrospinota bacterium M3_3B_026]